MMAVELRESFVKIRSATKIPILFFYPLSVWAAPDFWATWLVRRHANVHRITTHGLIDRGHLDFNNSKVVELHRCNLSDSDWNPWTGEDVA
jgi:hypothetical protein